MLEELNTIKKDIKEYLELKLDLIKLNLAEKISKVLSSTVNIAVLGILSLFILFFLSMSAGYFFASLLNSNELGFLCVAGFYILILVLFLLLRKQVIEKPVIRAIVKLFFQNQDDNEK